MSRWVAPSRTLTVTVAPCSSGGTEYRFPRKATSACADTVLGTVSIAGNGSGIGASGSASARDWTVARPSVVARSLMSPRVAHHVSSRVWACSTVTSSGRVRQNRCAATWFAFSTTPLRFPRRGGHGLTLTP